MLRILESQAPAKQTATDTISTLSNRLSSATLLEDRRAAILGLRSFAKQFPASVASGALRDLIAGLRRDGEDPDTLKVVLETLLMLFEPDEKSPEASEDIPLWLADEFTQRQDNITALLDLLETGEFYLRLYSLQILSQICAARPQRTQEAIFTAPLGVSRITAVLDERREAVRNEGLLLLAALTPTSAELQKVVAFENAFDRVFALIENEGGLTHGSTTVQDCLSLLSNLLKMNTSNQAYFREIGCVARVSKILAQVIVEEESPDGVSTWMRPQRDINLWGLLTILQLFLVKGAQGTTQSQDVFWKTGVLQRVLQIAFHQTFGSNVRARALDTCANIIRANPALQEQFGDLSVPALRQKNAASTNGHTTPAPGQKSKPATPTPIEMSNVIESLLELTLESGLASQFEIRLAACNCVKAFFEEHNGIRGHVLRRAIEGHKSGEDAIPNILTVLLEPPNTRSNQDPYQQWMAAVLLEHLLYDFSEAKAMALKVSDSDESGDEEYEMVTFVQSITSNIVAGVQHPEDERALLGYLMLLSTWLFEDPDSVNDLLGEGSTVQGLISAVKVASPTMPLVAGMCSFLLGIIYEFSTKDSPIPRATLHTVVLKNLSREIYVDRLTKLRESPFIRDFEVLPLISDGGLPEVFFEQTFVDFFKDNFSRLSRAIDRDPSFEVSILTNGIQKGVSRELVDSLRSQIEEQKSALESTNNELTALTQRLEQEELEHRRTREGTATELTRIKHINQSLQNNHDDELETLQKSHTTQVQNLMTAHEAKFAQLQREHATTVETSTKQHKAEKDYLEQRRNGVERELSRLKDSLSKQAAEAEKASHYAKRIQDEQAAEITSLHKSLQSLQAALKDAQTESDQSTKRLKDDFEHKIALAQQASKTLEADLNSTRQQLQDSQRALETSTADAQAATTQHTTLQASLKQAENALSSAETRTKELEQQLANLELSTAASSATSSKRIKDLEAKVKDLEASKSSSTTSEKRIKDLEAQLANAQKSNKTATEASEKRIKDLETQLATVQKASSKSASTANAASEQKLKDANKKIKDLETQLAKLKDTKTTVPKISDEELAALRTKVQELEPLREKAEKQEVTQMELDDLLVVFADLEAKRSADKKRLKDLGEEVSENEESEEEAVDDDVD